MVYVRKTTRKLKQHISEHKSAICRNDYDYVHMQFNDTQHDASSLQFYGTEKVKVPPRGGDRGLLLYAVNFSFEWDQPERIPICLPL